VAEVRPGELWVTHGAEEALIRWSKLNGVPAKALNVVGYAEEDDG
jgi:putative mRNA 3-end processing factor